MDPTPLQITLLAFELLALAFGSVLLCRFLNLPGFKPAGPWSGRLIYWPVEGVEIVLLVALFLLLIFVSQGILVYFFGEAIKHSKDRTGLEAVISGIATHGGGLLIWPVFFLMRQRLFASYGAKPPAPPGASPERVKWRMVTLGGFATLLAALPLVVLVGLGWTTLLNRLGLPEAPQDSIAIFQNTQSPLIVASMFFIACVLAPINEEMLFRRGLYHFFRQRFGRIIALILSGSLFGLLHMNLAGFLPLSILGVVLALAYERTGDIRVPIIAHGLFNLNTIVALLAGLSG